MRLREKLCSAGVILAFILLSAAYTLILPPWEGFDEPAHYSYISSLADRGEIPDFRKTPFDACMEDASAYLPRPYASSIPFEANGGLTYRAFFADDRSESRKLSYEKLWVTPMECSGYKSSSGINYQGQHPPLYYILMTLPYKATTSLPPGWRIFLLRCVSVLMACMGLYFWLKTILLFDSARTRITLIHGGLVVLFFPSMFYDLARMGNDCLASLLLSATLYFFVKAWKDRNINTKYLFLTGTALGLGLLTKIFFITVLAALCALCLYLIIRSGDVSEKRLSLPALAIFVLPLLISAWWFWLFHQRYGFFFGGEEKYLLSLMDTSSAGDVGYVELAKRMILSARRFTLTFLWSGTWSWLVLPNWHYVFIAPLLLFAAHGYIFRALERNLVHLVSLSIMAFLLMGFAYNFMNTRVRYFGHGPGYGGYYLFLAWPALAALFSYTFTGLNTAKGKALAATVFVAALLFEASGWWREILLYSGIMEKAGANKHGVGYVHPFPHNISMALDRLKDIAFPYAAVVAYAGASAIKMALAAVFIFRPLETRHASVSPGSS